MRRSARFVLAAAAKALCAAVLATGFGALVVPSDLHAQPAGDCNRNGIPDAADADGDGDEIPDACDVCPQVANPDQTDTDFDGFGNACDPDVNNDGLIGLPDFNALRALFGTTAADPDFDPDLDLNDDGAIGIPDFNVFRRFFGAPPGPGKHAITLVRGYLAARPRFDTPGGPSTIGDIYVPGVRVFLRNASSGLDTQSVLTDLSGRFTVPVLYTGRYRICWEGDGYVPGCTQQIYSTVVASAYLHASKLLIQTLTSGPTLFGTVRFADGSVPRTLAPLANVNAFPVINAYDPGGNLVRSAYMNNFGEYLLPALPGNLDLSIEVLIEGLSQSRQILSDANLAALPAHQIPIQLQNHPPRLDPIVASVAGVRAQIVTPGAVVDVEGSAEDRDGDALSYRWRLPDGTFLDGPPPIQVQIPDVGLQEIEAWVFDGKGGYDHSSLLLRSTSAGVRFSGKVLGADMPNGLPGAEVDVNGATVVSDASGFVRIEVPQAPRYVFTVRKAGYGFVSRIYDDGVTGGRWTLPLATVATVDPKLDITVVERCDRRNRLGPRSFRLAWDAYPGLAEPRWQDGRGNAVAPFGKLEVPIPGIDPPPSQTFCPEGARLQIRANSLVDEDGNPPPGLVQVSLSGVDLLSPQQMPGDYTVDTGGGTTAVMQSWGAVIAEITDGTNDYNLRPGATAILDLPVDPSQLGAAGPGPEPPVIPILFYDETAGVWRQDGTANLVGGNVYRVVLEHFSAVNGDTLKTDQSCVRVLSPDLPAFYDLEVQIPQGGGAAPKIITQEINNAAPSEHVVYNLPSSTDTNPINIILTPIRQDTNVPIGNFVVNTGGPQFPTSPNLPVGPPYEECSTEVVLHELVVPEEPLFGEFLHGLYTFFATNLDELDPADGADQALLNAIDGMTADYYEQIDPRGKRLTLQAFRTTNGFAFAGDIRAVFANGGDLGFGRDMHCVRNGADVACYVTNYGDITTPDSDDVVEAANADPDDVIATVAMEYSRIESPPGEAIEFDDPERVVKFYVYSKDQDLSDGDGDDDTVLLRNADLDGFGARPVPQLCMVCHGGEYPGGAPAGEADVPAFEDREDVKLGSRFLPFDLRLYEFTAAPFDKASQQDEFQALNEDIVRSTPPEATAVAEVIDAMYAVPGPQDEDFSIKGWDDTPLEDQMYRDTVAPSCRTCHIGHAFPALNFVASAEMIDLLGQVETRVCVEHVMPHAKRTHDLFWLSTAPSQVGLLQLYGDAFGAGQGWDGDLCGEFTPGGDTPVGFYQANVQPIWELPGSADPGSACTNCHTGNAGSGGLTLDADKSFDELVGVLSESVNPGTPRIDPGSVPGSLLHQLVTGATAPKMPLGGGSLDAADIQTIEDWIDDGAPE